LTGYRKQTSCFPNVAMWIPSAEMIAVTSGWAWQYASILSGGSSMNAVESASESAALGATAQAA
jgi:hypothetical protein